MLNDLFLKRQQLVGSESEQPFSVGYYRNLVSGDLSDEFYVGDVGPSGTVGGTPNSDPYASESAILNSDPDPSESAILNNETWSNIWNKASQFSLEPEDDPDYTSVPTATALAALVTSLGSAMKKAKQVLPRPLISPDGLGGLRVEWRINGRQLRFIARANQAPYLYHQ
ncbi:MAG TPA: hypothetical protein VMS31_01230, partial [Pyrinomonadaceae bacterium]|nr:hypothetical protein [Pyrinomonadaceae bacterium]